MIARTTIDYGIDLGTTNSTIAVLVGTTPEVISDEEGSSITPSAIWFDKRGQIHVGREARVRHIEDEENTAVEFKLRMGEQQWQKTFQHSKRKMLPEEMSAEVLKELKNKVRTFKGEDIKAAVVTVPAAFELPQCEATRRASELAGFINSPLLQEPVAAALAYGFQSTANKVFWLVYDFGGGTFDAAVIQVRDGVIQVINHAGDNYLGGKNIDWDIVEKLFIPQLMRERNLTGFARNNPCWRSAFAKLKDAAEKAKIRVSRTQQNVPIYIDNLCDNRGDMFEFSYELRPTQVQQIIEPWVNQSISLCQKALQEKGLCGRDIERVILVGGSSLFPWLQERVAAELGVKLDFSIDPITVVARGAAVFAGTQRLDYEQDTVTAGIYKLRLEYEPIGNETDPLVGGCITSSVGETTTNLTVEIIEIRSQWRSGGIRVSPKGVFEAEVHAEKGRRCEFQIILTDARGTRLPCTPDRFSYTIGMVITSPPLTHHLGVAMSNNKPVWFSHKGDSLPARGHRIFNSTKSLRKNEPESENNAIMIPIIEGINDGKADRNRLIGHLKILPGDPRIKRDVPLGSEIEVNIEIATSRTTRTKAYIPILDEVFEEVFKPEVIAKSPDDLRREFKCEVSRLEVLKENAEKTGDNIAQAVLKRLENEQIVDTVHRRVEAAQGDLDARGEADRKLLDLKAEVDIIEDALEWPSLVEEARRELEATHEMVEKHGQPEERTQLKSLKTGVDSAIAEKRVELLKTRIETVHDLRLVIIVRQPGSWIGYLEYLQERRTYMIDKEAADRLFTQAQQAINNNDFEALKAAVRQLVALLPPGEREKEEARRGFGSTIIWH